MRVKILIVILLFNYIWAWSQSSQDAWVYFNNKPKATYYLENPEQMLSERALERRIRFNIVLNETDVPVDTSYIATVKNVKGVDVLAKSKWLNALHVTGNVDVLYSLLELPFVEKIEFADKTLQIGKTVEPYENKEYLNYKLDFISSSDYGSSFNQINMVKGNVLHQNNFKGDGIQIAVLDAGFPGVNSYKAFKKLRDNNKILGGYDFVNGNENFYTGHYHGTSVLSTMVSNLPNEFVGTAPNASYYLFITEDYKKETPLEESLWVEAAEKADSLGVDIISTSLGYTVFDNDNYNYSYEDLNGSTAFISRGATIAFSKGMVLVNSAGNEGNSPWKYVVTPADVQNVLSVGAVNSDGIIANFSSFGPTANGTIKPDVSLQGKGATIINSQGVVSSSNGTSFSAPILSGLIACLWQAFPNLTNTDIVNLVRESGHLYANPTDQEGYGIPNFNKIFNTLNLENGNNSNELISFPNPALNEILFHFPDGVELIEVAVFSYTGKSIISKVKIDSTKPVLKINHLNNGLYFIQIKYNGLIKTLKLIKN